MSKPDRFIRKPEVLAIAGVSDTTIWRWEKIGLFPKRIPLGPNTSGWLESEVHNWRDRKLEERARA